MCADARRIIAITSRSNARQLWGTLHVNKKNARETGIVTYSAGSDLTEIEG